MPENLKHVKKDDDFRPQLEAAGIKLVVVDFYADWCEHCQTMGPVFERLAPNYPKAIFLKVNVDECTDTAISFKVKCLPSFFFFHQGDTLDAYCGGHVEELEARVKKWYDTIVTDKQVSLASFIDVGKCDCQNECQDHALKNALTARGYLESNSSSKLMITVKFTELVNVQSIRMRGPSDRGPKTLKLFVNQTKMFEFQDAEEMESSQTLQLKKEDIEKSTLVPLHVSKFQSVSQLSIYVTENQNFSDKTQINHLTFFGSLAR